MTGATWCDIPGYGGVYEVSESGEVRSHTRAQTCVLRPSANRDGYPSVILTNKDGRRYFTVHVLVMLAFVGQRPEGAVTRHRDGDPLNNHISNLVYGSPSENAFDCVLHGTHPMASKTHCKNGHEFTPENTRFPKGRVGRMCVACIRIRDARRTPRRPKAHHI